MRARDAQLLIPHAQKPEEPGNDFLEIREVFRATEIQHKARIAGGCLACLRKCEISQLRS